MADLRGPIVAGEPAAARLLTQTRRECRNWDVDPPTARQIAMVLHALADHTAIEAALRHRPDPDSPWPHATSMGRWFHDVGDQMEGIDRG